MDRTEQPIDLSALAAREHPGLEDRVVAAAMARVRVAPAPGVGFVGRIAEELVRIRWPALAAATAAIIITTLLSIRAPARASQPVSPSLASAVGIPGQWVGWMVTEQVPSTAELLVRYGEP
jgi:hypothetical protein